MPTIQDVAREAGVSTATVSHVLNGTRYVSPALKQRVRRAVEVLRFHRSFVARSLRIGRTQSVGLVVSDILNPFFGQLARAVEDRLRPTGHNVIICNTDENLATERDYLQVLADKRVDGIILAPTAGDHRFIRALSEKIPVVLINRTVPGAKVPLVCVDNRGGARRATEHLISHGHQRIGMILGVRALSTSQERLAGYSDALRAASIQVNRSLIREGKSSLEGAQQALLALLSARRPPTAVFVGSMSMIVGTLLCLRRLGVRCPEDVAVVAFTDFLWCQITSPPLTCVQQPVRKIGEIAADLFLRAATGKPELLTDRVILPAPLIVRESCGCTAKREAGAAALTDLARRKGR